MYTKTHVAQQLDGQLDRLEALPPLRTRVVRHHGSREHGTVRRLYDAIISERRLLVSACLERHIAAGRQVVGRLLLADKSAHNAGGRDDLDERTEARYVLLDYSRDDGCIICGRRTVGQIGVCTGLLLAVMVEAALRQLQVGELWRWSSQRLL